MNSVPILYTAIGDSLTVGEGAFLTSGFVKRYTILSEQALKRPINVNMFARSGATSSDILQMMRTRRAKKSLYYSSMITFTVGGDDLIHAGRQFEKSRNPGLFQEALQRFFFHMAHILRDIAYIKGSCTKPYIIRLVGLYNPLSRIPGSDVIISHFNSGLERFANPFVRVAQIQHLFTRYGKSVLSPDGIHPNGKGYELIADRLYQTGYFPFR